MALELSIPDKIAQLDGLNDEQLKGMLNNPQEVDIFVADLAEPLCEMRQHQQAEIMRIAKSNLENKKVIESIIDAILEIRDEVDTLRAMNDSLQQRRKQI